MFPIKNNSITLNFFADACFSGCGATFHDTWIYIPFPDHWRNRGISFLELYPLIVMACIHINQLCNNVLVFHTDNYGTMSILNSITSKHPLIMVLMRQFVLLSLKYNFRFSAKHIPGLKNNLCDSISRSQVSPGLLAKHGLRSRPLNVLKAWVPTQWDLNHMTTQMR